MTLVEALVALSVISLVAASAMATAAAQTRLVTRARETSRAEWLAAERLAMLRVATSTELRSLPDSVEAGRYPPPHEAFAWRVSSAPVLGESELYDVEVRVDWGDGSYALRSRLHAPSEAPR